MIVKLIISDDNKSIAIWDQSGKRLFYSDKEADVKTAQNLLTVQLAWTDAEKVERRMGKTVYPKYEVKKVGYFGAYWLKGIVQLNRRATASW